MPEKSFKEYTCPNGNSKISSMDIAEGMTIEEYKNFVADLKMMTKKKIISAAFSEHIINNISEGN